MCARSGPVFAHACKKFGKIFDNSARCAAFQRTCAADHTLRGIMKGHRQQGTEFRACGHTGNGSHRPVYISKNTSPEFPLVCHGQHRSIISPCAPRSGPDLCQTLSESDAPHSNNHLSTSHVAIRYDRKRKFLHQSILTAKKKNHVFTACPERVYRLRRGCWMQLSRSRLNPGLLGVSAVICQHHRFTRLWCNTLL